MTDNSEFAKAVVEQTAKATTLNDNGEKCCSKCKETDQTKMGVSLSESGMVWFCNTCKTKDLFMEIEELPEELQETCKQIRIH